MQLNQPIIKAGNKQTATCPRLSASGAGGARLGHASGGKTLLQVGWGFFYPLLAAWKGNPAQPTKTE